MKRKSDIFFLQLVFILAAFIITFTTYSHTFAHAETKPQVHASANSQLAIAAEPELSIVAEPDELPSTAEPELLAATPELEEQLKISNKVNDYVKTVKGVSDSVTAVFYDQCFVAIKCEDVVEQSKVEEIKKEIKKSIPKKFKMINNVFISSDLNAFVKLDNVMKRVLKGEDFKEMKLELMELRKLFNVKRMKVPGKGTMPGNKEPMPGKEPRPGREPMPGKEPRPGREQRHGREPRPEKGHKFRTNESSN